jgi:hypothetical protein
MHYCYTRPFYIVKNTFSHTLIFYQRTRTCPPAAYISQFNNFTAIVSIVTASVSVNVLLTTFSQPSLHIFLACLHTRLNTHYTSYVASTCHFRNKFGNVPLRQHRDALAMLLNALLQKSNNELYSALLWRYQVLRTVVNDIEVLRSSRKVTDI